LHWRIHPSGQDHPEAGMRLEYVTDISPVDSRRKKNGGKYNHYLCM
jgi:hypothetical protein